MRLKNKSSIALIVIGALVMALAIALAACNAHQHAFSDEWSFDDSGHWHAATCGDTDEVRDMAEHAIVWGEVTSPATCETAGVQKGSCLCGYTTTRPVEATGHDFAPSWGWNSDFSSAILTLICGNDPEHTHTVTATVSSEDGADACSDYVMHTATATYDGKTYTDSKRIETESHHLYELSEWIWDGDLSGAKAKFVCQRDASHVLESERVASVETGAHEDATCTVDGYTEYKVSVQLNGQTYEGTTENGGIMRKTLTKLGHDFDTPWQYDEGQHWHKCSRCDETDAHVGHTLNGDGECATCGYTQITPVDEFDFSENGSTWRITGYNGSRTNVVIPSEYRGLPVTEIGMRAFYGCESIRKLTIPQTITGMGSDVFIGCVNIEEVTSPAIDLTSVPKDSLRKLTLTSGMRIEANAFKDYTLLAEITFPDSIRYVGKDAFANTAWLAKQSGDTYIGKVYYQYVGEMPAEYELRLRDDTAYITEYACYGQTGLASLMIPDSVTEIGAQAFSGCTGIIHVATPVNCLPNISNVSLTDIEITKGAINADTFKNFTKITNATIGANVTSVAQNSFSECLDLESISVVPENSTYQSLTGVVYNKADKSIYIVPKGLSGEVTILDGCQRIEENTFSNYANITSITISNSIVSIGNCAFGNCVNLQTVNWNATNCTTAGSSSKPIFEGCTGLATINIGENVENIPAYAFYACTGLQTVTIGEGVTSIGNSAFKDCTGLQTVNWNATNCTSAGNYEYTIFKGCTALATVNIGENVESIPAYAFQDFTGLQTVTIPDSVTSIGDYAFSDCAGLQTVTIGECVTNIGSGAFSYCTSLSEIIIPDGVESIGGYVFDGCTGLRTATIGEGVESIGRYAFYNCTRLATVNWNATNCTNAGIDTNRYGAKIYTIFKGCTGLATVNIGENVESIPEYMLYDLTMLSTLNWNAKSCTKVSSDWLSNCPELTTLNLGAKVERLYSFENFTWLRSISVSPENDTYQSYQGIVYKKENKTICCVPKGIQGDITILDGCQNISGLSNRNNITSVTIPDSVTSIGYQAFYECTSIRAIYIPDSVTSIDDYAFYNCSGITKVNYLGDLIGWCKIKFGNEYANPLYMANNAQRGKAKLHIQDEELTAIKDLDGLTQIPAYAFYGLTGITSVTIPESVTNIANYAFEGCTGITKVNYLGDLKGWCSISFANSGKGNPLYIANNYQQNQADLYLNNQIVEEVDDFGDLTAIPVYAFYGCKRIISVTIPDSVKSIGTYAFCKCTGLKEITITDSETSIGYYAFQYCTDLQTVTIESGSIGGSAFYGCTSLQTVTIGAGVTSIGNDAFSGCTGLQTVTIEAGSIGGSAFYNCTDLQTVTIESGSIGSYAFYGCTSLQTVTIGAGVTSIGQAAFRNCTGITRVNYLGDLKGWCEINFGDRYANPLYAANNQIAVNAKLYVKENGEEKEVAGEVNIPVGTTMIGKSVFFGLTGITSMTIPESVQSIDDYAFYGLTNITSVTIPDSATSIGDYAFSHCTGLTEIIIPENVKIMTSGVFESCIKLHTVTWNAIDCSVIGSGICLIFSGCSEISTLNIGENVKSDNEIYRAFEDFTGITTATMPAHALIRAKNLKTVTITIGDIPNNAFKDYTSLQTVTICEGVTSIGDYAFSGCTRLKDINIPDSITGIGSNTFLNCIGLQTVTIGNSVTSIGDSAFYGCTGLQTVTIPDSATSIGDSAFYDCTNLQKITIGSGVTSIGDYAFRHCTGITKIVVSSLRSWCEIKYENSYYDHYESNPLYAPNHAKSGTAKLYVQENGEEKEVAGEVNIPVGTTKIGIYAFYKLTGITSVIIPESVTSIGSGAFNGCTGITMATIPAIAIDSIPKDNLNTVTITSGDIPANAYKYKTALQTVTIGNSVTSIGDSAFSGCYRLQTVTIGNSVTSIGDSAFYGCTGLQTVTIGEGVTSIGIYAFSDCTGITRVNYLGALKDWCEIEFGNGGANPLNGGNAKLYVKENGEEKEVAGEVNIPDGLTEIGNYVFYGLTGITSVTIPESVTSIGNGTFTGCKGITTATMPANAISYIPKNNLNTVSITSGDIPNNAFKDCTSLQTVTICEGVTSICDSAFSGCTGLQMVTIGNGVTSIGNSAFYNCTGITRVNYLGDLKGWCEIEFSSSPLYYGNAKLYVKENGEEKELAGEVNIPDGITKIGYCAFCGLTGITFVNIPASVTTIGSYAFSGCTGLQTVTIPESVTTIGSYAFSGCTGLQTVTISDSVTSIGNSAFEDCTGLQTVTIGNGVTSIGDWAFSGCTGITRINYLGDLKGWCEIEFGNENANPLYKGNAKLYVKENGEEKEVTGEVTIPVGTTKIGKYAFYKLTVITAVTIPDSVTSIGSWAFYDCTGLQTVTIGEGVTSIGWAAFRDCTGLRTVTIPDSVTSIGDNAFESCTGLQTVTIGDGVTSIGEYAFYYCTGLQAVTIPENVTSIGNNAFYNCENLKDIYYAGSSTQWGQITKGDSWNQYWTGSNYQTIEYQMHYNSTGPEAAAVSSSEATGYEGQERIAEVRVPEAWMKQD